MQKNKDLIIFTYDYPFGMSEKTFIDYEISKLSEDFKNIEIINQKTFRKNSILNSNNQNIKLNPNFSKKLNIFYSTYYFLTKVLFKKIFWEEIFLIIWKKNFFRKLKMCILELCNALILFEFLKININKENNREIIFYSFWSNFTLITFSLLKDKFPNSKFIARSLGSDLNGYLDNDYYVPYKRIKFSKLNKIILLGEYQKKLLSDLKFDLQNVKICPLGVNEQKISANPLSYEKITFLSCGSLIKLKNVELMINFLKKFSKKTSKKIEFILIGSGKLEDYLLNLLRNNTNFTYEYIRYVKDLVEFINKKNIHFFLNFSSQEGMPFTVMETMSCGIPTIASNIDANKYLVKNNGYILNLEDYDISSDKIIDEIIFDLENIQNYKNYCENSNRFINQNLINKDCYNIFLNILKNI